jgi:hypothetical protein
MKLGSDQMKLLLLFNLVKEFYNKPNEFILLLTYSTNSN